MYLLSYTLLLHVREESGYTAGRRLGLHSQPRKPAWDFLYRCCKPQAYDPEAKHGPRREDACSGALGGAYSLSKVAVQRGRDAGISASNSSRSLARVTGLLRGDPIALALEGSLYLELTSPQHHGRKPSFGSSATVFTVSDHLSWWEMKWGRAGNGKRILPSEFDLKILLPGAAQHGL
ncbi:hypothetical protein PSPO01_01742 [Paraphaeosphaeria sporulosa]